MLSKLESQNPVFNQKKIVGSLESFSSSANIILGDLFGEIGLEYSDDGTHHSKFEFEQLMRDALGDFEASCQNPTERFIEVHDKLVGMVSRNQVGEEVIDIVDRCFDKIIHEMINRLKRTSYKQFQSINNSYSMQDLIQIRTGIVCGSTIALNIIVTYLERLQ